ncbi:hypothetical protein KIW84_061903 [Lathyrus oleraceus]|uniref:DUF7745 domain-containing protein n=1 Tax=Pisum sativum TaxID=3888 RepID=A0A9D4W5N3_PEA|nr:hypothetical protein KIW84_061903 [Pisum sativum]
MKCLKELPPCFKVMLEGRFSGILSLLTVKVQTSAITALAQFYDPPFQRFLFQDFHLTLVLKEFEGILGSSMKGRTTYNRISQLTSHVLKPNALIGDMSSIDWAQTLVSLTERDITWYRNKLNIEEIIIRCGIFPKIPLIGSTSYISYNPMLVIRRFGYPILGKLEGKELEEMILDDMGAKDPTLLHKIVRSWEKIHTKGPELRKRDGVSKITYQQWVLEGVKAVKLPFY